jgi:hypothetical protein
MEKVEKEPSSSSSRPSGSSIFHSLRNEFLVHNDFNKVAEVNDIVNVCQLKA